jgi:hypothetical protein
MPNFPSLYTGDNNRVAVSIKRATWEAEIRRISIQGQPGKIACKIPSPK